ncbi:hypothetical protein ElyMa_001586300 [Elysia marginata]|uniref:Armadillo repeat-containing domain-containing protein n=1 Tax=Elysia marginata TaxID=1093978 RepID=A0AAV4JHX2_9GAST|nr:hypothetical protein ElyMa_001586300 [Elysia marginata]
MGSPDGTKIALGLLASTSALILSYILLKKYGFRANQTKLEETENEFHERLEETTKQYEDKTEKEPTVVLPQEKTPAASTYDNEGGDDGQNQTSFIVLDDLHGAAPPEGDNGVRKSDKSSDESSYDVVEDDRMAEMEEVDNEEQDRADENASAKSPGTEKSAGDRLNLESSLETSMVMVEEAEQSNIEKSASSFYTSADENFGVTPLEDSSKLDKKTEEDDMTRSDQAMMELSATEDETTVMYKSGSVGNDTVTLEGKDSGNDVAPVVEDFVVPDKEASEEAGLEQHIDNPAVQAKLESHAITDAVLRANLEVAPVDAAAAETLFPQQGERELNMAEVTEVLSKCQSTPMSVTKEDIGLLVHLMRKNMPELQATVLNSIVRIAAFNQNTRNIRESGCPEEIVYQLRTNSEALITGETEAETLLTSICQVLTNLSMDPKAHPKLEVIN